MTEQTAQQSETTKPSTTNGKTATVNLPFMTAQFRRPAVHLPGRHQAGSAASRVKTSLPSPVQMLYYTGLGALAVAEVVEWPVAVAIGAGTLVAQRTRRPQASEPAEPPPAATSPSASKPAEKATAASR